ncbi:MAG TPA: hypothetical protein VH479_08885, partial [Acidimicrobiales bacterium]
IVFLAATAGEAAARRDRLDERLGREWRTDADVFTGTAAELAERLAAGREAGLDGWRLRPGEMGPDLAAVVDDVVPALNRAPTAGDGTLRSRLRLPRPASRYARSAR